MRILFFTESLIRGGKERRMLELMKYIKQHTDYEMSLVIMEDVIEYEYVYDLGIPIVLIERKGLKYDPRPFIKFYKYCSSYKPDIIHAWTKMSTFYAIPAKLIRRLPLITSMIADALTNYKLSSMDHFFYSADFYFPDVIISNSKAGLKAYKINSSRAKVIWNGVSLERFQNQYDIVKVKDDLRIATKFMVVMVATFSLLKDYDLFLDVAKEIQKIRNDVTFAGIGDGSEWDRINRRVENEKIKNVVLTGQQKEVEKIIAASDIGILCTYSEGISNSIIECMAMGKPVISTDLTGGSKEIILEGETGYCCERNVEKIVYLLDSLLNNTDLRISMGNKAKDRIASDFTIKRMGEEFAMVYKEVLAK
jgi:glycosyltransferase involved in cell wall biosynthesis